MEACIITFQSIYNYGAVFQAFALQKYLRENFAETKILDYHNKGIDASYSNPRLVDFIHNPKNATFRSIQGVLYKEKREKFDKFRKQHLRLTKRYDISNISEAKNEADVFITGSDQVWNYLITNKDGTYYLDFTANKSTCSYAASFGIASIPNEYIDFYKEKLGNIEHISVRENNGIKLVEDIVGRKACLMPDPTLLVDRKVWDELSVAPKKSKNYILVYKITKADQLLLFAKRLSKKTGLPIIYIPNDLKNGIIGKLETNIGPEEWLGCIKNAEYIVTNSFHGTVFSILFNKKFFAEVSDKVNPSTSRLKSLLWMFQFENRTVDNYSDELLMVELDREKIQDVLNEQRKLAYGFFCRVFER